MFLKVKNHNGYDEFYYPLNDEETTWKEILGFLESALDEQYLKNEEKLEGIKIQAEIVKEMPEDVDLGEEANQ